jgi:hypothetical protein
MLILHELRSEKHEDAGLMKSGAVTFGLYISLLLCIVACVEERIELQRTSVDVRVNADDGLSERFRDALRIAFQRSRGFVGVRKGEPADMTVTITKNVEVVGSGMSASVDMVDNNHAKHYNVNVYCSHDIMLQCVNQVISATLISVRLNVSSKSASP